MPFKRGAERRSREFDPQTDRRKQGLGWISLFHDIDEEIISKYLAEFKVLSLPAGSVLLKPGDKNDNVYLLLSGQLIVYFDSAMDSNVSMLIQAGECIGELSAIDGKPVSAFVIAHEEVRVLQLNADALWNHLMPIPGVGRNLLAALSERMRRSNQIALQSHRKQLELQFLKKELEVAHQLQAGMLPLRRPLFTDRNDIEIAGMMEPASEIGGDLFDAFFVDENLLFFSIGDVSGHGIPAALFMARIIGLMRIAAMSTNRPDLLLQHLNSQLVEGNNANMFVTMLCGFLDVASGRLSYSNAGHCAPLLLNRDGIALLPIPQGVLAGVLPDMRYSSHETVLAEGEILVCYTDGVTEAQSLEGKEFSVERLMDIVAGHAHLPLEDLLQKVRNDVADFTCHRALSDDCTMLTMRRKRID